MISITPTACSRLCEMLTGRPDHVAARIVRRKGRLKLRSGTQRPGDEVFEHDGRTLLFLGEKVAAQLKNRTLEVRDSEDGPRLRLRRGRIKRQS